MFGIDNHYFEVMSSDFVPIHPYTVDHILVGIGKSYNIIVACKTNSLKAKDTTLFFMPNLETTPNSLHQITEITGFVPLRQMAAKGLKMVTSLMSGKVFLDISL